MNVAKNYQFKDIVAKLKEFNKDLSIRSLRERYNTPTFFEITSISRKENHHSAFLKWLLQGDDIMVNAKYSPLMGLLDILLERAGQQRKEENISPNVKNAILSRTIKISNIITKCERVVGELKVIEKSTDRIDIHIVCDVEGVCNIKQFEFVIENKIGSKEGDEKLHNITNKNKAEESYNKAKQTERYVLATKYAKDKKPDFIKYPTELMQFYVFLTPLSNFKLSKYDVLQEDETCASKKFIHINYQDIVDYIIEPTLSSQNLSDRVRIILNEYLNNLSMPCEEEEDKDKNNKNKNGVKNTIIMATYNEDIETIKKFWQKYEDLVLYCVILKKALMIKSCPSRQELFNEYIISHEIGIINKYVWKKQHTNKKRIEVDRGRGDKIYVKDVSNPNMQIERIKEFEDLYVIMDFYEENKSLILAVMKILSDVDDEQYETIREVYNTLTNPKDYTKYKIILHNQGDQEIMNKNKREVVVSFIENLGHELKEQFINGKTYKEFFNERLLGEPALDNLTVTGKDKSRYNAYEWDSKVKKYKNKGVADKSQGAIYFSNQWGCLNNQEGTFDKFLEMVKEHFIDDFEIINM